MKIDERGGGDDALRQTVLRQRVQAVARASMRRAIVRISTSRLQGLVATCLSVILVVLSWWALESIFDDPVLLPGPGAVAKRFWDLATASGQALSLWPNLASSLVRVLVGWGAGVASGVVVGVVMSSANLVRALADPLIEFGRPIPPLAFVPLLVVWFGIGEAPKIILLWFATFPVVVVATVSAIRGVDMSLRRAALSLGASQSQVMSRVVLRMAAPEIVTGMRIASGLAWSALIAAEIIASTEGLGFMILQASRFLETGTIFVGIAVIGAVAFAMDLSLRTLEHLLAPWKGRR